MDDEILIRGETDVLAALNSTDLHPPAVAEGWPKGATRRLRDEMARFSSGSQHRSRRDSVAEVLDSINGFPFEQRAADRANELLTLNSQVPHSELAQMVPTEVMGEALGVKVDELDSLRADTDLMVASIGRGHVPTAETEASVERLLARFPGLRSRAVASVSILYQNYDATTALVASVIEAKDQGCQRQAAVKRTVRVASNRTVLAGTSINKSETVVLDLESAGLEFGGGPHECPGREIAEAIARGISAAVGSSR